MHWWRYFAHSFFVKLAGCIQSRTGEVFRVSRHGLCSLLFRQCKISGKTLFPLSLIALQGASGTLFFAPFLFFTGLPDVHNSNALLSILYLGTLVTLGGYGLDNYALSNVSVLTAAAYINLIPIFSLLLSTTILDEGLNSEQWLSILIVFASAVISQRHKSKTNWIYKGKKCDINSPLLYG